MTKPGRPTLYTPEMGERVLDLMREGLSITATAGELGFGARTFYDWEAKHPAFAQALNLGRAARLAFWERLHLSGKLPPASTIFALKNACKHEWREKIEHAGDPDAPIRHEHSHSASAILLAELEAMAKRQADE